VSRDLMHAAEIRDLVANAYEALADPDGPAERLYDEDQLAHLPKGARRWALGVGNPVPFASLSAGEVVVDLGSGAGIDALLAAREVGPSGRVIGIELLEEMVSRTRRHAVEAHAANVEIRHAPMESLPLPDDCADVVISNGAINLCARKSRVLAEAFRVLRPGGRLCVSDLTVDEDDLPTEVLTHPSAWAG
jgi:arsenite methyltransferase